MFQQLVFHGIGNFKDLYYDWPNGIRNFKDLRYDWPNGIGNFKDLGCDCNEKAC